MTPPPSYRVGTPSTPKVIKILVLITTLVSLIAAITDPIFTHFGWPTLQTIFGLSLNGIDHFFLWQFITYLFIHPVTYSLSIPFVIHLAFNMYLLWVIGGLTMERIGIKKFLCLYFLAAVACGLVAWGMMFNSPPLVFSGSSTAIYALMMTWLMIYSDVDLLLFFLIPFKAKWAVVGIFLINLLVDLSHSDFLSALTYFTAILFGYFFGLFILGLKSPFKTLQKFEGFILHLKKPRKTNYKTFHQAKIYDFETGEAILDDDEFMDSCLARISLYGEDSLTWKEKFRMNRISRKKKKK